jgi:hypothetical protein
LRDDISFLGVCWQGSMTEVWVDINLGRTQRSWAYYSMPRA